MKKITLTIAFFLVFISGSIAQINPVENLTWYQVYESPNNYFELRWEEPAQPHGELLGYNVYRNNELYRFQTETTVYNLNVPLYGEVSNCSLMFLGADNQNQPFLNGIDMHVTAVYGPGQTESDHLQTVHSGGLALAKSNFVSEKAVLFPNPTTGMVNIGNQNLSKIELYDTSGKMVKAFVPQAQIDLVGLSKGMYLIKLFSDQGVLTDKIILE